MIWVFESEFRTVAFIAIVFTAHVVLEQYVLGKSRIQSNSVSVISALLIVGAFFGVIFVTDENEQYRQSGGRIRTVCGVVTGLSLGFIFTAPIAVVALAACIGAILGYYGMRWARYV